MFSTLTRKIFCLLSITLLLSSLTGCGGGCTIIGDPGACGSDTGLNFP